MAVYVDKLVEYPWRYVAPPLRQYGLVWCHMYADTEEELDCVALAIGLKLEWKQRPGTRYLHYDLTPSYREAALAVGAIDDVDRVGFKRIVMQLT